MTKIQQLALFLVIIIAPSLYLIFTKQTTIKQQESTQTIEIKPITIPQIKTEKAPSDILSQLKVATHTSKLGVTKDKEEVAKSLLDSLEEKVVEQKLEELQSITQSVPLKQPKSLPIKKVTQKVVHKKLVHKKVLHKKVPQKHLVLKKKVQHKKKIVHTKEVKLVSKKKLEKKMPQTTHRVLKRSKEIITTNPKRNGLSREEEVALYEKKYAHSLEVVNVSKPFEIKEKSTIPDEKYFEPIKTVKDENPNAPLKFVKKLGVVAVSNKYETHFEVPKKIEVAKEGIVNAPNATTKTEEIENLKPVKTLGVVQVSKAFESIKAKQ